MERLIETFCRNAWIQSHPEFFKSFIKYVIQLNPLNPFPECNHTVDLWALVKIAGLNLPPWQEIDACRSPGSAEELFLTLAYNWLSSAYMCHAFEQNSAREHSLFLARPHGTLSLLTSVTKFAQLPSRRNWKLFDCIWHRFYVTIVMHLRSYSSGGTTKFLTWTWTWMS